MGETNLCKEQEKGKQHHEPPQPSRMTTRLLESPSPTPTVTSLTYLSSLPVA